MLEESECDISMESIEWRVHPNGLYFYHLFSIDFASYSFPVFVCTQIFDQMNNGSSKTWVKKGDYILSGIEGEEWGVPPSFFKEGYDHNKTFKTLSQKGTNHGTCQAKCGREYAAIRMKWQFETYSKKNGNPNFGMEEWYLVQRGSGKNATYRAVHMEIFEGMFQKTCTCASCTKTMDTTTGSKPMPKVASAVPPVPAVMPSIMGQRTTTNNVPSTKSNKKSTTKDQIGQEEATQLTEAVRTSNTAAKGSKAMPKVVHASSTAVPPVHQLLGEKTSATISKTSEGQSQQRGKATENQSNTEKETGTQSIDRSAAQSGATAAVVSAAQKHHMKATNNAAPVQPDAKNQNNSQPRTQTTQITQKTTKQIVNGTSPGNKTTTKTTTNNTEPKASNTAGAGILETMAGHATNVWSGLKRVFSSDEAATQAQVYHFRYLMNHQSFTISFVFVLSVVFKPASKQAEANQAPPQKTVSKTDTVDQKEPIKKTEATITITSELKSGKGTDNTAPVQPKAANSEKEKGTQSDATVSKTTSEGQPGPAKKTAATMTMASDLKNEKVANNAASVKPKAKEAKVQSTASNQQNIDKNTTVSQQVSSSQGTIVMEKGIKTKNKDGVFQQINKDTHFETKDVMQGESTHTIDKNGKISGDYQQREESTESGLDKETVNVLPVKKDGSGGAPIKQKTHKRKDTMEQEQERTTTGEFKGKVDGKGVKNIQAKEHTKVIDITKKRNIDRAVEEGKGQMSDHEVVSQHVDVQNAVIMKTKNGQNYEEQKKVKGRTKGITYQDDESKEEEKLNGEDGVGTFKRDSSSETLEKTHGQYRTNTQDIKETNAQGEMSIKEEGTTKEIEVVNTKEDSVDKEEVSGKAPDGKQYHSEVDRVREGDEIAEVRTVIL